MGLTWRGDTISTGAPGGCDGGGGLHQGGADKDLFGMEITIPAKEYERQFVVVNQQGLICTFLPIGLTRPRRR